MHMLEALSECPQEIPVAAADIQRPISLVFANAKIMQERPYVFLTSRSGQHVLDPLAPFWFSKTELSRFVEEMHSEIFIHVTGWRIHRSFTLARNPNPRGHRSWALATPTVRVASMFSGVSGNPLGHVLQIECRPVPHPVI